MQKWMPIKGDFSKDGENIIFKGIMQQSTGSSMSMPFPDQPTLDGMGCLKMQFQLAK